MRPAARRYEEQGRRASSSYQLELGTKSLLGLFLALAIVCGLFFAFGYTLGKHAIPATFSLGATATARPAAAAPAPAPGVQPPNPAELGQAETNQTPDTLTTTTTAAATPAPAAANGAGAATPPAPLPPAAATASPSSSSPAAALAAAPPGAGAAAGGGIYHVQVFAGAANDAQSLAASLVARGYPAAVVAPAPGEANLYRVQVGPYLTPDEAQAMRSRLTADGYPAIVKNQ